MNHHNPVNKADNFLGGKVALWGWALEVFMVFVAFWGRLHTPWAGLMVVWQGVRRKEDGPQKRSNTWKGSWHIYVDWWFWWPPELVALFKAKCIVYCFLSIHCDAVFIVIVSYSVFVICFRSSFSWLPCRHWIAFPLTSNHPVKLYDFCQPILVEPNILLKPLQKTTKRLRLCFFHWPEVFSLRVKEKQQRSGQKVKMVNPTCKMLIPQKSVDFCSISAGWTSTMYPENCHPKDTGPIQKHPLNLPWCGETEYQNEKILPIFFCHQKKMAGMVLLCADAGWL